MKKDNFQTNGNLVTLDLWGVDPDVLNNPSFFSHEAKQAAEKARMEVLSTTIVSFKPQGLSLALILGESHLTIHTAPEHKYVAIDIFTCGQSSPMIAGLYLCRILKPKEIDLKQFQRGRMSESMDIDCAWGIKLIEVEYAQR